MSAIVDLIFGVRPKRPLKLGAAPDDAEWRHVRPRRSDDIVHAELATQDQDVETSRGSLRALKGQDMIVTYGPDDHAVVRRDLFERTYEPAQGGFRKRTDIDLRYFTLDRPAIVETLEGPQRAEPGDWIMEGTEGELWPVKKQKAERKYKAN